MDITKKNIDNQLIKEDKEEIINNQLVKEDEEEIKINSDQKIHGATELKVIQNLNLFVQHYSKLENMLRSLDQCIICEKYYNQVIRNNNFIKRLQNNLQFLTSINKEYNSFKKQLEKITNQLNECKQQRLFDIDLIKELETKNNQLIVKNNQLINENNQLKK
ncbi:669_t:CDS:2 [Gigaspora margarita]|uniref:669_t:CDS:1 n=1 Tax=Gigaspora margarita TaxID=4874 RepID=A0ABN7VR89_GIGMA|nr:669_t:CDS:2 [Gigaspora margarita]